MKKTLKCKNQARHGDLLLQRVEKLPENSIGIGHKRYVLAEGSATGHTHVMMGEETGFFKSPDGSIFVVVQTGKALLVHEEHATIEFSPGVYQVIHQVEYDAKQAVRQVAD